MTQRARRSSQPSIKPYEAMSFEELQAVHTSMLESLTYATHPLLAAGIAGEIGKITVELTRRGA